MLVITDFHNPLVEPCLLTMGNFDGIHLGHQSLLRYMQNLKGIKKDHKIVVITFINHPLEVLHPTHAPRMICCLEQKLLLLQEQGVDIVCLLEFTKELSELPYDIFIRDLKSSCNFTDLILGQGSSFGKDRQGIEENVKPLSEELGFACHYLPKYSQGDLTISSGNIRKLIQRGELKEVAKLLGRPYSLFVTLELSDQHFVVAGEDLQHLELPSPGTYNCKIIFSEKELPAIAYLEEDSRQIRISCDLLPEGAHGSQCEIAFSDK